MRTAAALGFLLLTLSCASGTPRTKANLIAPDLAIRQIGGVGAVSRHLSGPISVNLEVDVLNKSAETIRLERIELQSIGSGAYTVSQQSRPFNQEIAPNSVERVRFFVPAQAEGTISGANGPVTVRVTAYFDSPAGQFREIYMRNINDQLGGQRVD